MEEIRGTEDFQEPCSRSQGQQNYNFKDEVGDNCEMCRKPLLLVCKELGSTELLAKGLLSQIYFRYSKTVCLQKTYNYWKQSVGFFFFFKRFYF